MWYVASAITNKFSDKVLPDYLAFFSGNRFVPVMTIILFIPLAAIFPFIWPTIFMGIVKAGEIFAATGAVGTFFYGFTMRLVKCIWITSRNISTVLVYSTWRISGSGRKNGSRWTEYILCTACRSIYKTFQCGSNKKQ